MDIKEFFEYFFGKGDQIEFTNFSLAHFIPIALMITVIFLIRHFRGQIRQLKREENLRYLLAFALIITEMSYFWRLVGVPSLQPNPVDHLPITVCGWAVIFSSYMVIGKNQTLFDIVYFWLFSGTIFALITPHRHFLHRPHPLPLLPVLAGAYPGVCGAVLHDFCP